MTAPACVVVVGASISGLTAAETLRQEGFVGRIVLIGDEPHAPYNRPPLSKQILLGQWEPHRATILSAHELAALDIELRTECEAISLDVDGRIVHTTQGSISFDELIIATGTAPRRHPMLPGGPTLRTVDEALRLRDALIEAETVAVIGSGILGSEIASAARKHGSETVLVGRSGVLSFGGVGTLLSDRLASLHQDNEVELKLTAEIISATASGTATEVTFDDGSVRRFDVVASMIGGTPRTQWLASSRLEITDGIRCDHTGSAAPGISAVGDVASWREPTTGSHVRVEHQSYAIEQAIVVATRLAHGAMSAPPVPLFWSELHDIRINAYGWFDPALPLREDPSATKPQGATLTSRDYTDQIRGVVGWNASPRDFRAARAAVALPNYQLAVPR